MSFKINALIELENVDELTILLERAQTLTKELNETIDQINQLESKVSVKSQTKSFKR